MSPLKIQITFHSDEWAEQAAVLFLIKQGTNPSRITAGMVKKVLSNWYNMYGSQMGSMDYDDLFIDENDFSDRDLDSATKVCQRLNIGYYEK